MPCFSASSEPWRVPVERPVDHHVERRLGLARSSACSARGGPGRAGTGRAGGPGRARRASGRRGTRRSSMTDLAVAGGRRASSRSSRTSFQPSRGRSTMNAVLAACGISGSSSVRAMRIANLAPRAPEMNHLWPLITHSSPSWYGVRLDQRRVGAGHLGLGHREARAGRALAQRPEVLLLLLVGAPVQQRVHVALVGRLGVETNGPMPTLAASADTAAIAVGPRPMPPHSFGMCGSQSPSPRVACLRSSTIALTTSPRCALVDRLPLGPDARRP